MNFTIHEKNLSRRQSTGAAASAELQYIIIGTISASAWNAETTYATDNVVSVDDGAGNVIEYISLQDNNTNKPPASQPAWRAAVDQDAAAKAALIAEIESTYEALVCTSVQVEACGDAHGTHLWDGVATYGLVDYSTGAGDVAYRFSTGGGTEHITQSLLTRNAGAVAGTPPDFDQAIGVTDNGVEGVDIEATDFRFSETHYFSSITNDYVFLLANLTKTCNDAAATRMSVSWGIGTLLLENVEGARRGNGIWEITFHFKARPNSLQVDVGDNITIGNGEAVVKYGHDYLWIRYVNVADGVAKALVKRPQAAYIEQVYPWASWTNMFNSSYTA